MGKFWGKTIPKNKRAANRLISPQNFPTFPQLFPKIQEGINRIGREFSTNKVETLLLLLLLLLFPTNLAKHFATSQSYILGLLIDYLSPAVYLTEVLAALLLLSCFLGARQRLRLIPRPLLILAPAFLLSLIPSVWGAADRGVAVFRFLELTLWLGFALWLAVRINWQGHRLIFRFLGWGVLWVSLLALGQFLLQRSLFGYWFLGEPVLSPSLGAAAEGSFLGREVLRAYGTFPHPNVLGGVLSVILVGLFSLRYWWPFTAGTVGTLVSLSRTALVSLVGGISGLIFAGRGLGFVILADPSISRRWELLQSAGKMIQNAPLAGVGLGQFVSQLPQFGIPSGLSLFLQPVHNVPALVAAESGVVAAGLLVLLWFFAFRETIRRRRGLLTVALLQLGFLGMVDHYLYTLPQGLFLFFLIIGLSFSYSER